MDCIQILKVDDEAILPSKMYPEDIGYDITAIKIYKKISEDIIIYDTGIKIKSPNGFYTEIIPQSSITKSGWMLANSVGIIDHNYNDNLYIILIRINKDSPEIELPFCKCQLVTRKIEYLNIIEVKEFDEKTNRGFGSINKKKLSIKIPKESELC